jgi:hypothetical protein
VFAKRLKPNRIACLTSCCMSLIIDLPAMLNPLFGYFWPPFIGLSSFLGLDDGVILD